MRTKLVLAVALMFGGAVMAQTPTTEDEKTIYALGLAMGKSLTTFNLSKPEIELLKKGLVDSITGAKPLVELEKYGPKFDTLARTRSEAAAKPFLEKAAKEKGATVLPSGLVLTELKAGTGPMPKATDRVKVHYRGTLIDGTEFDSSYARKQPAEFPLQGVIPCWTEGLQKVKVGGKAKLVCPAKIAYGPEGRPPKIPGGATLIFEVELLEILAPQPTGGMPGMPGIPSGHGGGGKPH